MGRKSMPPLSSQPESVKAKLGMALSSAPAPAAIQTAIDATSAALHSKDFLNIACSLSGVGPAACIREHGFCITRLLSRECRLGVGRGRLMPWSVLFAFQKG